MIMMIKSKNTFVVSSNDLRNISTGELITNLFSIVVNNLFIKTQFLI